LALFEDGMPTIRLVLVEDNRLVREGLTALLDAQDGFEVIGAVETAKAGLAKIQQEPPDVALIDSALQGNGSRKLVEAIRATVPGTRVIVMDLFPGEAHVLAFIQGGASGFVVKDATLEELFSTIRAVARGESVVPPAMTGTLLTHLADQAARTLPNPADAVKMTRREREVIALIAEGLSNKEIAQRLSLAPDTVKSHVHNILEKLALHSRLQIAAHAHRSASQGQAEGPPPAGK
jgi:DNA-binding NarL/FixJ family response regulator